MGKKNSVKSARPAWKHGKHTVLLWVEKPIHDALKLLSLDKKMPMTEYIVKAVLGQIRRDATQYKNHGYGEYEDVIDSLARIK